MTPAQLQAVQDLRLRVGLQRLVAVLERYPHPWALLKGPVLGEHYYARQLPRRTYVDLDLLVEEEHVAELLELVRDAGGRVDEAFPRTDGVHEMPVLLPGGATLDLHWQLVQQQRDARDFPIRTAQLLERRQLLHLDGTACWSLDDVDTLLHVALHAVVGGGRREREWLDVDQVVRTARPDWSVTTARASELGLRLVLALALDRAVQRHGTPVPEEVHRRLGRRSPWILLARRLDGRRGEATTWVVGNTRSSSWRSARSFLTSFDRLRPFGGPR